MKLQIILEAFLISAVYTLQTGPGEDFYHAAVVEYNPLNGKDGEEILQKNGAEYVRIIKKAAETADIVVFPEIALNYLDLTVFIEIPFGSNNLAPADNPNLHPVLRSLSQAARDNKIYVSFTVHEKDDTSGPETLKYNTEVVLDRNGEVVLRYRKFNLFNEPLNITKVPEVSYFDSDFGVRFGVFICFDIMFKEPANQLLLKGITDFIFPSWWFSLIPSLLSVETQMAWAYIYDANLLAAGVNSLQLGSTGSGIYAGRKGPVVYIFSERNETRILTAKIYKKGKEGQSEGKLLEPLTSGVDSNIQLLPYTCPTCETHLLTPKLNHNSLNKIEDSNDDSNYTYVSRETINKTICQGTLCCEFSVDMTFTYKPLQALDMSDLSYVRNDSYYHYQYRLNVFNGAGIFNCSTSLGLQVCGIIPCLSDSLTSCSQKSGNTLPFQTSLDSYGDIFLHSTAFNDISIKAFSKEKPDVTFPLALDSSKSESINSYGSLPDVSKIYFFSDGYYSKLQFSSDKLIYAGINSRLISRDNPIPTAPSKNESSFIHVEL